MTESYDLIVIGTGAANIVVDAAARQGLRIALIEKGKFGGTCLNRGCIPTKILVTAADYIREIAEAKRIGVMADNVTMDWSVVSRRLWDKVDGGAEGTKHYYAAMENIDIYEGTASFTGKKDLHIALNNGSSVDITGKKLSSARVHARTCPNWKDWKKRAMSPRKAFSAANTPNTV